MAGELDVDLVEIAANASPPVCRLMDYGKFKYQEQKKAAEAKAKQTVIEIKEVKFRPGTDDGDYNIKLRNIRRFLAEGDKCKITLRFRGREITHQQLGLNLLNRLRDDLADSIQVEQFPKLEGRQMIMMMAPAVQVARSPLVVQNHKVMASLLHLRLQIRHNCGFAFRARVGWPTFVLCGRQRICRLACKSQPGLAGLTNKCLGGQRSVCGLHTALRAQFNRSIHMPKMKTKSSAKKRFRVRPGGTVKRGQAFKRHILTKKTTKNKRHLRGIVNVHEGDMGSIAKMLPSAGL
jgi:translation initiation factor IF-3